MSFDMKDEGKKIMLVFGAIMTSTGLQSYIPADTGPLLLVVCGIGVSYLAVNTKF